MSGSDGACGEDTDIFSADDLIPQQEAGNENVAMWEFDAENEDEAITKGRAAAFMDNWTAHDSVSDLKEV